ncbi:lipopolysaccharide biosynthesis protein RfbH [Pseudomonas corrugata]|jgi:CDP-6-deoxy-D-xylo-4-hexulose-3-dehydrase|uniref:Lipopolysaccharide biosynthesis protein RfbH n=1 Tax=Pseudomonas corrugata TaxID=47879 RepID=A0A7Y6DHC4_9PSED|nr:MULTISPECIES: lipopolysaccharide biosynthesis protein RfbH [Pseudomonas]MBD0683673.1 lipopolysaccharide biosynthesis protein RfbH [Pseudomonas sp. PSB18]MCI0992926.1 lipopolysaccharide biosynthesis protein RfbH [Pseudomonas corrugata]MDU9041546.1 lipopolysaccharide biosynthesis protein RfbH [Pseudomonas corrugata]NUT68161.1 lipopolysaccharide biosynthesis protein RfbH [Pseudomonas corrugata]NUT86966.1 lipopolysaccharide biosynthesis protein RfbH [Pseudomonas corrugata]
MSESTTQLRQQIVELVGRYAQSALAPQVFVAGQSSVPPAGKVIGAAELQSMTEAVLDGWLTTGRFNEAFEKRLAQYLGRRCVLTTNSGSSANLLAFSALTSPRLGDRAIKPGDEVIGVAAGFPTTVNPILQFGAVPVFVDVELGTYNIDPAKIEAAIGPKTKAIMLAHTLGNPYDLGVVRALCDKYKLWLIEDCCDALGSTYKGRMVGTFGDIGTLSFYPAHHITMGEGGAVFTDSPLLKRIMESFRDWGRDCYCEPGQDNTCKQRFCKQMGELPEGYDHKYTYSHLGYNLKITDMQAACALAQMDRVEDFTAARKRNFRWLSERLANCSDFLILPEATPDSDPSWFGFPVTLRDGCGIKRVELLRYLDSQNVGTRLLFAGNLVRQPYMLGRNFRISGELTVTDKIMNDTFWIGVWPGLGEEHLGHAARCLEHFFGLDR